MQYKTNWQDNDTVHSEDLNRIENNNKKAAEQLLSLTQHSTIKSGLDDNGIFTIIELNRADGTLYCKSELSGGESPLYTHRKEIYYSNDGSTIIKTINYSRAYNEDDLLLSEVII